MQGHSLVGVCLGRDNHRSDDCARDRIWICEDEEEVRFERRAEYETGKNKCAPGADQFHERRLGEDALGNRFGHELLDDGIRVLFAHTLIQQHVLDLDRQC